ncbi:hypothetical protein BD324DRAFT_638479 [Kockovaella imperatae]|uniref:Uncharacterized protein n=1 Tax=Kockovaella imperatae TaxID=4999 RepID=A0A1Y1U6V5_9TREE|nr:hypothetical protein BD324DRAFT_638479 [Kockovaella imperatae]ORX33761.1 hypothetical protein BD324DRAFT_638479 [Kockovaella imperatae]
MTRGKVNRQTGLSDDQLYSLLSRPSAVSDINTISTFLSSPCHDLPLEDSVDTVFVLLGSSVLPLFAAVAQSILTRHGKTTLVISGGRGHSTQYLYDAVAGHPVYHTLADKIQGLSEAEVIQTLLLGFWPDLRLKLESDQLRLMIEDRSTNCGSNAMETKRVLQEAGISPERIHIIQDPTMHRRTLLCFMKAYGIDPTTAKNQRPDLRGWTFEPTIAASVTGVPRWDIQMNRLGGIERHDLWNYARFFSLIMGEIPRLRDDGDGYGPRGAGFIPHEDIPHDVESAWRRLNDEIAAIEP